MQWSHQMKTILSFLAKMGTHLSNFGYSLTCSSRYTGHQSPFFNVEQPSPVRLRCSWSQFFVRNWSKTEFSSCAFPLLLPWLLQRLSKWNSWTHMALSTLVGNQSPVKLGHCAHMGKGCALRIVIFFTATPKFISISHTFTLLPVTLIS